MDFLKLLPMAFVMVAGPQVISSFFFATSPSWKKISGAYVLGAAISIPLVVGAAYLLTKGGGEGDEAGGGGLEPADYVVLALLLFAMFRTFTKRDQSEPPKWMGKLQNATPKAAFILGFLLLGIFPSDLITSISVGAFLAHRGDPYLNALPFIGLTLLFLATPALMVIALGDRAQTLLPRVRDWMNANSWIVSEIVLAFFILIILSG
jgi:Sap, sulfolipid-1-addressing protein